VILGNEVLDAMPVQRFRVTAQGADLLHIGWDGSGFVWCAGAPGHTPANPAAWVPEYLAQLMADAGLTEGYESEYNPYLNGWLGALGDILEQGVIVLIDYGYPRREYYHPQRHQGTLICHYRHRAHDDPLILPGLQDISASVDFTAVSEAATAAGLQLAGYTSQNYFLFGCGLEQLLAQTDPGDSRCYLELTRQVKLLTLPAEMGERCKAIAFSRKVKHPLCGFSFFDERERL
jgi:SAM-dependent MidA family methyltransferase